jgi:type II secretory pathway predicted ATPase ExeA
MFLEAFGLRRDPFMDTADPAFYYDSFTAAHYRRRLVECLAGGRGLAVIVGAIGAGKTTLLNAAASDLLADDRNLVGLILDPTFADETELLTAIADSFGFDIDRGESLRQLKDSLKRALFEAAKDKQPILLIDEAQTMPEGMLETLRSLLNFQLDDRKLLAIALSGQPELAGAIARRPNLSDRVALWLELGPLRESESVGLIEHRLRRAGYKGERSPFEDDALHELWLQSLGVPRRIVALARESMEIAAERVAPAVVRRHVEAARARVIPPKSLSARDGRKGALARLRQWFRRAS